MREQTRELADEPQTICKRPAEVYFFYFVTLTCRFYLYVYSSYFSPRTECPWAYHKLTGLILDLGLCGLAAVIFCLPSGIISDRLKKWETRGE